MRRALIMVAGILVSAVIPCTTLAATVIALTVEELTQGSDRVVRARVVSVSTESDAGLGMTYRLTGLEVLEDYGGSGPRSLVLRQLGGEAGGSSMHVAGDARFEMGEEVVVFLRSGQAGGEVVYLEGLSLGKFRVARDISGAAMAVRDIGGLHLLRPGDGEVTILAKIPLENLRVRVGRVLAPGAPSEGDGKN